MYQSGIRPGPHTVSVTTLFLNCKLNCLDNSNHCAAIFIDLSKAFDTLDHPLLIQRLSEIGIDQVSCKWFGNYLSDRTQCVVFDGVKLP